MATRAAGIGGPEVGRDGDRAQRRFFSSYAIGIALVIFVGFTPSFFLRGLVPPFIEGIEMPPLSPVIILHALMGSAFALALPLQSRLIAIGRVRAHVKVGRWAVALGLGLLVVNYLTIASGFQREPMSLPSFPQVVETLPLTALMAQAGLLWAARHKRFDAAAHKRLMIALFCLVARPAIARMFAVEPTLAGLVMQEAVFMAMLLPLWIWDLTTRRRPHWATVAATLWTLLFSFLLRGWAAVSPAWIEFVTALPGFGG